MSRKSKRLFRKRRNPGKIIGTVLTILLIPAMIVAGYYLIPLLSRTNTTEPSSSATTVPTDPPASTPADTPDTSSDIPDTPTDTVSFSGMRMIYLPSSALRDLTAWEQTLTAASAAGYNAVLFDLKGADGVIRYASATELAVQAESIAADALTMDELKAALQTLRDKGFTPVPRLYAFADPLSPRHLENARITVQGSPKSTWYDNAPDKGGKRWLNPYAPDARRFITELAAELRGAGCDLLMLDGVQFPNQTSRAYFGEFAETSLSRAEILSQFAAEMTEAVGSGHWMLSSPALAAIGDGTQPFGGNPLTFGAPAVSPMLLPSSLGNKLTVGTQKLSAPASHPYEAVSLLAAQIKARVELIAADKRPAIVPWIQADDYSAAQIADEVRALTELYGEKASYILYHPDGRYVF